MRVLQFQPQLLPEQIPYNLLKHEPNRKDRSEYSWDLPVQDQSSMYPQYSSKYHICFITRYENDFCFSDDIHNPFIKKTLFITITFQYPPIIPIVSFIF